MFFHVYDDARIDPGSAFRLVVKVGLYVANEYGPVDMCNRTDQLYEIK